MRHLSAPIKAALASPVVRPALLVTFSFSKKWRFWTGSYPLIFGGENYIPAKWLVVGNITEGLDHAQQTLDVEVVGIDAHDMTPASGGGGSANREPIDFAYSGEQIRWTVPEGVKFLTAHLWGAGGGRDVKFGGRGGYTRCKFAVVPGQVYSLIVGQGGVNLTDVFGFGGRGQGAAHQHNGGGLTGIFKGRDNVSESDMDRAVCIAGGGGAGGWNGSSGTDGGGGNSRGGMPTMRGRDATGNVSSGYGGGGGGYSGGASTHIYGDGGSGYIMPSALESSIAEHHPHPVKATAGTDSHPGAIMLEMTGESVAYDAASTVTLACFDEDGNIIGSHVLFSGTVESSKWKISPTQKLATITLKAGEAGKESNSGERYNDASQRRRYPGDAGLSYVQAMQSANLKWGGGNP